MIQRIQSLYLLLASGAYGSLFALPFLTTSPTNSATIVPQLSDGVLNLFDNFGLLGLTGLGSVLALVTIFLYKNRNLQGKLTGLGLLAGILLIILAVVAAQSVKTVIPADGSVQYGAGFGAPLIGMLLFWLAGRAIKKDEQLVRSMDRLR